MTWRTHYTFIFFLSFATALFGAPIGVVNAQSLSVDFEASPLFIDADIKPGDSTTRRVIVTNAANVSDQVSVDVLNTFDTGLGTALRLLITADGVSYFDDTFATFFASAPHQLGSITGNSTRTFDFTASLPISAGNEFQTTQLGFDLVIGFASGPTFPDTPPRGRGADRSPDITIFNEAVTLHNSAAIITWNTNLPATSYVVCGDLSTGPFTLTSVAPLFGYQFVIPETNRRFTLHEQSHTNLRPGTYECRPASRRNQNEAFTVGRAVTFQILPSGEVAGEVFIPDRPVLTSSSPQTPPGSVLGLGKKGMFGAPTYDEWRAELDREQAEREAAIAGVSTTTDTSATGTQTSRAVPSLESSWIAHNRLALLFFIIFLILSGGWLYFARRGGVG